MLRYPALIISTFLCLASSAMAQQYYPYNGGITTQLPPGHYYCQQHREICTHGMSTPEVGSYYPAGQPYYPAGQANCPNPNDGYYNGGYQQPGYGQNRGPRWNNGRGHAKGHRKHNRRYRRW